MDSNSKPVGFRTEPLKQNQGRLTDSFTTEEQISLERLIYSEAIACSEPEQEFWNDVVRKVRKHTDYTLGITEYGEGVKNHDS